MLTFVKSLKPLLLPPASSSQCRLLLSDYLMAWVALAIAAGGSANWELAFMGLPSVIVVIAENQRALAKKLHQQGVVD